MFLIIIAKLENMACIKSKKMGIDDYLVKPFIPEKLLLVVDKFMENIKIKGTIQVESQVNQGSSFLITIPKNL